MFLSRQSLTLRRTYHDAYNVRGGRISLSWPGYGGHIEIAYEGGTYIVRLPHDLVRAGLVPFTQDFFEDTHTQCLLTTMHDPNAIVRAASFWAGGRSDVSPRNDAFSNSLTSLKIIYNSL